jgi:Zn-dependent M16 (insulinase) family peptidase
MVSCSYLEYLRNLEKTVDEDWPTVAESLEAIRSALLARKDAIVNLTSDERTLIHAESHVATLLDTLPEQSHGLASWDQRLPLMNEGLVIPTQVNYVGKAASLYDAGYELNGSAYVISKFIGNTWLWDRVRVSGGAYGGFCDFDSHSGVFSYLSYRDPNLVKTLDNYDGTVQFLRDLQLDDDALTKAIIGTIGDVDAYQLPDAKGYTRCVFSFHVIDHM